MTLKDTWNPQQYERFKKERELPFRELLALIRPQAAMRVVDLGCGTGELTRSLHRALQAKQTVGLDSSEAMLERSAAFVEPGLRFEQADLQQLSGHGQYDLVFSHAALQWVPDHPTLLRVIHAALAPGGQLAVQLPANQDFPSHTVAEEIAAEAPFRQALLGPSPHQGVLTPEGYSVALHQAGFGRQHVRLQVFAHLLDSREEVVEWVKGTLLTDYQRRLPAGLFDAFVERYRERLLPRLDPARPYLYPFKRILLWAQKGEE